jgi:hypothetical protein
MPTQPLPIYPDFPAKIRDLARLVIELELQPDDIDRGTEPVMRLSPRWPVAS